MIRPSTETLLDRIVMANTTIPAAFTFSSLDMFLLSTPSPSRAKDPLPIGGANEVLTACLLSGDLRRSNPEATHPGHASSARLHDPHYLAGLLLPETFSEVVSLLLLRSVDALSQARAADFRRRCRNARKLVDSLRDVRAKIFTPRIADAVRDAVAETSACSSSP